jgi:hypothetical protein
MNIENKLLILICFGIFILYTCHKQQDIESFLNPCQYHQLSPQYARTHKLKTQYGRPGIEIEKEKLYPAEYRTSWERFPQIKYKFVCNLDEHLNRKCHWVPIYTKFYPDLKGEQENMISP